MRAFSIIIFSVILSITFIIIQTVKTDDDDSSFEIDLAVFKDPKLRDFLNHSFRRQKKKPLGLYKLIKQDIKDRGLTVTQLNELSAKRLVANTIHLQYDRSKALVDQLVAKKLRYNLQEREKYQLGFMMYLMKKKAWVMAELVGHSAVLLQEHSVYQQFDILEMVTDANIDIFDLFRSITQLHHYWINRSDYQPAQEGYIMRQGRTKLTN